MEVNKDLKLNVKTWLRNLEESQSLPKDSLFYHNFDEFSNFINSNQFEVTASNTEHLQYSDYSSIFLKQLLDDSVQASKNGSISDIKKDSDFIAVESNASKVINKYSKKDLLSFIKEIRFPSTYETDDFRTMSYSRFSENGYQDAREKLFWERIRLQSNEKPDVTRDTYEQEFLSSSFKKPFNYKNSFFGEKARLEELNKDSTFPFHTGLSAKKVSNSQFSSDLFSDPMELLNQQKQKTSFENNWEKAFLKGKVDSANPYFPTDKEFSNKTLSKRNANQAKIQPEDPVVYTSYSQLPNVYDTQKIYETFQTNFEPLSCQSWFVFTQFSFGFIILNLMKSFYQQYGKELLLFCVDFLAELGLSMDDVKEELGLSDEPPALRIHKNLKMGFDQVAGFESFIPQLYDIVWFLKNGGRPLGSPHLFSNSILLVGPPGTGKTFLVQAIAGEAEVPVLVQSCSALLQEKGPEKLQDAFKQAREMVPCILFLDELDTIGVARNNMLGLHATDSNLLAQLDKTENVGVQFRSSLSKKELQALSGQRIFSQKTIMEESQAEKNESLGNSNQQKVLTQLLKELDGLEQNQKMLVIGATNRVETLDFALTRPGRFYQIMNIGLPSQTKRIQLFKLYADTLGYPADINWEILAKKTAGLSAAYISSIVNESTIRTIYNHLNSDHPGFEMKSIKVSSKMCHTMDSLEHALEFITKSSTREKIDAISPFNRRLLAYYQAGNAVVTALIQKSKQQNPSFPVSLYEPTEKTGRYNRLTTLLSKLTLSYPNRLQLEQLILEQFGGKAGEVFACQHFEKTGQNTLQVPNAQSTLGVEALATASFLSQFLIFKIFAYSPVTSTEFLIQTSDPLSQFETSEVSISQRNSSQIHSPQSKLDSKDKTKWNTKMLVMNNIKSLSVHEWFRLRLSDPNQMEQNVEWLPLSTTYQTTDLAATSLSEETTRQTSWNDLSNENIEKLFQSVLTQQFNLALEILDENRLFLDVLSSALVRNTTITSHSLEDLVEKFL
nr:Cell division protein FTSH [Pedinophyceae sp. YPF-701]